MKPSDLEIKFLESWDWQLVDSEQYLWTHCDVEGPRTTDQAWDITDVWEELAKAMYE